MAQISSKLALKKHDFLRLALGTLFVLLIPLIANQYSSEVNWQLADFVVMALLCLTTGFAFVILSRINPSKKWLIAAVLLSLFCYIWAELAVGVFTTLGQ
ncbi:hypothetical protein [Thalassotalea fusca]